MKGMRLEDLDPEGERILEANNEDSGSDSEDVERLKKESAGKDRKLSQLLKENEQLKARLEETGQATTTGETSDRIERLMKLEAKLEAEEKLLVDQTKAFNEAVKTGVPVSLAISNASRWKEFEAELAELADSIRDGLLTKGNQKTCEARKTKGLDYAQIAQMKQSEIGRIPASVRDKLLKVSS